MKKSQTESLAGERGLKTLFTASFATFVLGVSGATQAQTEEEEQSSSASTTLEEITVTGTRIQRSGFESPSPVTVINREAIDDLGLVNVGDIMKELPMNNAEVSATNTSAGSINGYVSDANIGAELANLRGLNLAFGTRTLTLVDGHRFVPSTSGGAVDLALIPSNMVQRTEVVTGGASAAYGSDAIAGVVNVVLDHTLEGIRGQIDYSQTQEGDGETIHLGLSGGTELFGGRGHIIAGIEYQDAEEVGQCTATRDWCKPWSIFEIENTAQRATTPRYNLVNNAVATATLNGTVIGLTYGSASTAYTNYSDLPANFQNLQFNAAGTGTEFWQTGQFLDDGGRLMSGGEGLPADYNVLMRVPVERQTFYTRFQYDLTDNVEAFAELSYGRRQAENNQAGLSNSFLGNSPFSAIWIREDNPYLPASVETALDNAADVFVDPPGPAPGAFQEINGIFLNKPISAITTPESSTDNETYRFAGGFDGEFSSGWLGDKGWSWDAYFTYGKNEQEQELSGIPRNTFAATVGNRGVDPDGIQFGIVGGAYADGSYPPIIGDADGIYGIANWKLAIDAVEDPDNVIRCRANTIDRTANWNAQDRAAFEDFLDPGTAGANYKTGPEADAVRALIAQCIPLNPLGVGNADPAAVAWATGTQIEENEYTQTALGGNAQGDVFDIWTGPVALATGFEYRKEEGSNEHNAPAQYWAPDYGSDFAGEQEIIEAYVETDFSLLRDIPGIQELNFNMAYRKTETELTDDSPLSATKGDSKEFDFDNWKVSMVWDIVDSFRIRATRSEDTRAPSFRELFFPGRSTPNFGANPPFGIDNPWRYEFLNGTPATLGGTWPDDPNGADLPRNGGGNPELQPETAATTTLGFVWQPSGVLDGLRVSLDYYKIELEDGIANVYTNGIIEACYFLKDENACSRVIADPATSVGTDPLTELITDFDAIVTGSNNTSKFTVKGYDLEIMYRVDMDSLFSGADGSLTFRALTTYMDALTVEEDNRGLLFGSQLGGTFEGTNYAGQVGAGGVDDVASFSESPEWQGTYSATYSNGPWRATLQTRWVGHAKLYNDLIGPGDPGYPTTNFSNASNTLNVPNRVDDYFNWTVSGSYAYGENLEFFGVINNLFDEEPIIAPALTTGVGNSGGGSSITNPTFYDQIGRTYRLGMRFNY